MALFYQSLTSLHHIALSQQSWIALYPHSWKPRHHQQRSRQMMMM